MNPIRKNKHKMEINEMWLSFIFLAVVGGLYLMAIAGGVINVLDMPDVHVSNSTGECVEVINYDPEHEYTCDNLPEKYNHVWVK